MTEFQQRAALKVDSSFAYLYAYIVQISILHQIAKCRKVKNHTEESEWRTMGNDTQQYMDMVMKHNVELDNLKKPIKKVEYTIDLDNRVAQIATVIANNMDNHIDMFNQLEVCVGGKKAKRIIDLALAYAKNPSVGLEQQLYPLLADMGQVMIYDEYGFAMIEQERKKPKMKKEWSGLEGLFKIAKSPSEEEKAAQKFEQTLMLQITLKEAEAKERYDK